MTITGLSSMATRTILAALTDAFTAETGAAVAIKAMGGVDAAKQVRAGEAVDIVILASGPMKALESERLLVAGSIRGFARSGMAIAVRSGTPHPDIADEAAVRAAVAAASKVAYSTGPSGDHLIKLCEGWGLADDRLVKAPPGVPVGSLVANGEADLGFQQLSELIDLAGVDVIGPLPPAIQSETLFAAGIATASAQPDAVAVLIGYLRAPAADAVKTAHGMAAPND